MLPSIKNLEYLLALKKYLHFSKAAKACFVSQSTLSAGIKKLENELQVELVERNNKYVLFTSIGNKVVEQARVIILLSHNLVKMTQLDFFKSNVVIGVIPTIFAYLLPKFLYLIKQKYLNIKVSFIEDTSENLLLKIENMELDFAIFALPYEVPDDIIKHTVFKENLYLVKHKDWNKANIEAGDLLLLNQGHCLRDHIINGYDIKQKQISNFSCLNLQTLATMIDMKMGVSFLPEMAIDSIFKQYLNLLIDKKYSNISRGIGIIYKENHPQRDNIIKLSKFLHK